MKPITSVKPTSDQVLIQFSGFRSEEEARIVVPDSHRDDPQDGIVVAVGPGRYRRNGTRTAMEVKVGDHVLFDRMAGVEIVLHRRRYRMVRMTDVRAIMEVVP